MEGINLLRGDIFLPFICCACLHPISFIPTPLQKQTFEAFLFSCNQGCHTWKVTDMIWMKPGGKIHDLRQSKNFWFKMHKLVVIKIRTTGVSTWQREMLLFPLSLFCVWVKSLPMLLRYISRKSWIIWMYHWVISFLSAALLSKWSFSACWKITWASAT